MKNYETLIAKPYPLGVSVLNDCVQFTFVAKEDNCGVILEDKKTKEAYRIAYNFYNKTGDIASLKIKNVDINKFNYKFYSGDNVFADPYSNLIIGNETYGVKKDDYSISSAFVYHDGFDWNNDALLYTPLNKSIIYLLHVRGFTAHSSSKVKAKGTYKGIVEKINYLKDLGITALELMPAYEFEEFEKNSVNKELISSVERAFDNDSKINYWGYKRGFYFAPKSSYAYSNDPVNEFKYMVKSLHENNIEVIMQLYFPAEVGANEIYEILRFWLINYHIDGFHLKGNNMPIVYIAKDPLFSKVKLFYDYIPENEIYDFSYEPKYKNLCEYSDSYMYKMRKVLKGDEDILKDLVYYSRVDGIKSGLVNFITNYYGFTLYDLVSYDRKHNEANGENNADGTDYNYSWNCGIEGKTRKNSVLQLRKRMMKNALFLLMSSKGTPLITSGDEIANSQNGNNNPYCQDNEVCYINWNMNSLSKEMLDYTKELIAVRKNSFYKYFDNDFSMIDKDHTGFPDLSYHGDEAWKADLSNYQKHLGIMYEYFDKETKEVNLLYAAYNMFWKNITFALPSIPDNSKWEMILSSGEVECSEAKDNVNSQKFELESRSIALFQVKFNKLSKNRS